ncbi:hypothetical protein [uncultured Victivallis sp.]|uniref:hypothetical protein n=1 Tax=uncultured Victivallis sp. TaxID=354118 RepID=UPI0025E0B706|nr:hypothetical protein [uncultured Victivallis sp.]
MQKKESFTLLIFISTSLLKAGCDLLFSSEKTGLQTVGEGGVLSNAGEFFRHSAKITHSAFSAVSISPEARVRLF